MYALFTELDIPEGAPTDGAATALQEHAVPVVRAAGAMHAYWLEPLNGRTVNVILFDTETAARAAAAGLTVGAGPASAPPGVRFRTVEVREVIARL